MTKEDREPGLIQGMELKMGFKHVMIDLETWGTHPFSMIISIGACVFDPYASMPEEIIGDQFEVAIDPTSYQARIDPATIMWWIDPEREPARAAWLKMPKLPLAGSRSGSIHHMMVATYPGASG